MKSIYKICLFVLFIPFGIFATNHTKKHEKTRKINKSYAVSSDAKLIINNKYGDVNITTWNKNNVDIEVIITVKGEDLESVEERLKKITIDFDATTTLVSVKTNLESIKKSWSWWTNNSKINYKINYIVKMPRTNSVDLTNEYGAIFLGSLSGKANIKCDYGKIIVGELLAENNLIDLEYCSSSRINYIKSGAINIDYSKLTIEKSDQINIHADYTACTVNNGKVIDFNTSYGSLKIGDATTVTGNADYTNLRFETIQKTLDIKTDYGAIFVKNLLSNFNLVAIDAEYTGIKIGVDIGAVFDFKVALQYASFDVDENMDIFKRIEKSTSKYYEGKYGKGTSNSVLKIRSDYGGVHIKSN